MSGCVCTPRASTSVLERSLTRVLLGILLLGNATNVLLLSAGGPAGEAPIVGNAAPR